MEDATYNENRQLRRQLDNLLRQARTNEKKQELFDSFGFEIIAATTPAQLRELLLVQMAARFQLHAVVLVIVDYDKDIDRLFYGHDEDARLFYSKNLIILDPDKNVDNLKSLVSSAQLGPKVLKSYEWMAGELESRDLFESAAYLPLIRGGILIGAMLLISKDYHRYQSSHGTDFLRKLSAMTAVAIENCLNQQRIKEIGFLDALTQVYNRRYFGLRFQDEIERSLRRNTDMSCMFLDVDFFKKVNDTYGHHIGDLVLTRMVSLIKEHIRASDIVARYGGEEFVVVLPETGIDVARDIAERLRQAVCDQTHQIEDQVLSISVSIGISGIVNIPGVDDKKADEIALQLLDKADKSLYRAKETGRNKVVLYESLCGN
jgi:two-component system, cell cycle response regulator